MRLDNENLIQIEIFNDTATQVVIVIMFNLQIESIILQINNQLLNLFVFSKNQAIVNVDPN